MTARRPCDTCGGPCPLGPCPFSDWRQYNCVPCAGVRRCPSCAGEGCFSDVMPASDALADAETLQRGWWASPGAPFVHEPLIAADHGMRVAHQIAMGWDDSASIVFYARLAARAAFRAVPGLRERKEEKRS